LYFNKLTDKAFLITHYFPRWGGNSLLVLLENKKAVLIDTPYDVIATNALLNWMENEFGELDISAIVTGFHQDNLGGNEVLIEKNIPVYGLQLTAQLIESEGDAFKKVILQSVEDHENKAYYKRYNALNLTPPDHTFDLKPGESHVIEIGKERFEFYFPGETHTIDNSVVYIHGEKLLFGGCMIRAMADKRPGYIAYANMEEWPLSVERVMNKFPHCKIVVPGHGFEGGPELIPHTIDILKLWNKNN
jgi:metallo-beta-lactamase class B